MSRFTALLFIWISLIFASFSIHAEINPFKKAKVYSFDGDAAWYFKEGAALKSASRRDGGDTLYYHLSVSGDRLRLRLSKNDPSGELENTRGLDDMTVNDVMIEGVTMPRFDWCRQNQEKPGDKIGANAIVMNDTCVNPGNGDFIMYLDDRSKNALKASRILEFVIEPYGRPIKLRFAMAGFAEVFARVDRPVPPAPVAKSVSPSSPVPPPSSKAKPKPKPVAKTCYAKAPADFASVVKPVAYPCNDGDRKGKAQASINSRVDAEKQKRLTAEAERKRQEEELRKQKEATKRVEAEWEKRQAAMWIKRCQKHWDQGVSPCYCEKYLDHAPAGVNNSCGR